MKKIAVLFVILLTTLSLFGCSGESEYSVVYEKTEYVGLSINEETQDYLQCDAYIQSGETENVIWLFTLEDSSTVTVEIDGQEYEVEINK